MLQAPSSLASVSLWTSSAGPHPSKSTGANSEMRIHHSTTHAIPPPAATITSKGQRCLHSRLQKAFQARPSGKLQHGNPGKELWRGKGDRLVWPGHCWVMAGHQKQKLLADTWRQGPDVERSQGRAGPSPPRGEQEGNGPLDSMQQSHHGYRQLPRSTMNLGLPPTYTICKHHDVLHFTVEKTGAHRGHPTNKRCRPESNTVALAPKPEFFPLPHLA